MWKRVKTVKKKRKRGAASGPTDSVACLKCGVNRPKSVFQKNEKLLYGVAPWCKSCMKEKDTLEGVERSDAREAYERDYQTRYHPVYNAKKTGRAARTVKRLTRSLMRGVLDTEFDLIALRRPDVQAYLAWIWEDLANTSTWEEFEEEIEAEADGRCQGCGEFDDVFVKRLFDVRLYPELALYRGNAVMLCDACGVEPDERHLGLLFSQEGLEEAIGRLRACLLEVG